MLIHFLIIGLGGACGSCLRAFLSLVLISKNTIFGIAFPLSTFVINITGCFFAGCFFAIFNHYSLNNNLFQKFILTGFFGGFTTFSAFSIDFLRLFLSGNHYQAIFYAILSLMLSVIAVFIGYFLILNISNF
jgi:CrcB protein